MAEKTIKLCMIGAGSHSSSNIYPYIYFLKGAQVVANADLVLEKAQRVAAPFGIPRSYTDYHEMLETEQPDGVMVCVSGDFHAEGAVDILERGFHVYTEKPPGESLAQVRRVLATKRKTGRICMTGYKKHFAPAYARAKAIVDGENFGAPTLMTVFRTRGPSSDPTYMLRWGCHVLDLMPFMFGPVNQVCAFKTPGTSNGYAISVAFENGAVGTLSVSDRTGSAWEEMTVCGSGGVTVRTENSIVMQAFKGDQPFAAHSPSFTQSKNGHVEQGFVGELQEFVAAIREEREPESSIETSAHSIAIHDAVVRSAACGQPVAVEAVL